MRLFYPRKDSNAKRISFRPMLGTELSPPGTGGVAASRKCCEATFESADGWSVQNDHPVRAFLTSEGASTPPVPGGDYANIENPLLTAELYKNVLKGGRTTLRVDTRRTSTFASG